MGTPASDKSLRTRSTVRTIFLDAEGDFGYDCASPPKSGSEENMGTEVNFHLGEKPLNVDTGLALDPRIVTLVKLLARRAADEDFEAAIRK